MITKNKSMVAAIIFSIISLVATFFIYPLLPEVIPTHFNMAGEIDAYGARYTIFLTGSLPLLLTGLFLIIPKIDPKKEAYQKHTKAYNSFLLMITFFMIAIHWIMVFTALGYAIDVTQITFVLVGILFIGIGNYMPQIRRNYTFGIRLPWALENDDNWRYTHRVGGYSFILSGILFILGSFVNRFMPFVFACSMIICLVVPGILSYLYYKRTSQ